MLYCFKSRDQMRKHIKPLQIIRNLWEKRGKRYFNNLFSE